MNPPAGWHPDPYDPAIDRYWDGEKWTGHTRPKDTAPATEVINTRGFDPAPPALDTGGSEAATELINTGIAPGSAEIGTGATGEQAAKKKPKWPWIVGGVVVAFLGLGAIGAATEKDEADQAPAATTTTSTAAPSTTTTTARPTTTAIAPLVPQTTETPTPTSTLPPVTTTAAPAATSQHTLEYSCSDATWRESMGAQGDELCGAPWKPRAQPVQPAPAYTPPPVVPRPAYTPPVQPQQASGTVHPGSFCSSPGATGVTTTGKAMVCGPATDGKNRWKSAG